MTLVTLLNAGFGLLLALVVELVPRFARWWDEVPNANKRAYRAWVGLLLATLLSIYLHLMGTVPWDFSSAPLILTRLGEMLGAWVSFVFTGETLYQATARQLPRKQI